MGLRRTRDLTLDDLFDMIDSANTSDIHANVLTSFANADLVMETDGRRWGNVLRRC